MEIQKILEHIEALGKIERYTPKVKAFKREVAYHIEWKGTGIYVNPTKYLYPTDDEKDASLFHVIDMGEMIGLAYPEVCDYVEYVEKNCTENINAKPVVTL